MTKQEYNENLKRYDKAMEWFDSKPDEIQVDKFINNFLEILEKLRTGALELKSNEIEIIGGFEL